MTKKDERDAKLFPLNINDEMYSRFIALHEESTGDAFSATYVINNMIHTLNRKIEEEGREAVILELSSYYPYDMPHTKRINVNIHLSYYLKFEENCRLLGLKDMDVIRKLFMKFIDENEEEIDLEIT